MNSFQMQEMNAALPPFNNHYAEEEQLYEAPKAPKLRAQVAPVDCHYMSLPQSKDELMNQ